MMRMKFTPIQNRYYKLKGTDEIYKCISRQLYQSFSATMQSAKTGWTCECHGIGQYDDGSIDWDYSTNGRFEEPPARIPKRYNSEGKREWASIEAFIQDNEKILERG